MSMNIHSSRGTKVVYCNPKAGYSPDQKLAKKHLTVGTTYTVTGTRIHNWHIDVFLKEVPGVEFNSVLFDTAT